MYVMDIYSVRLCSFIHCVVTGEAMTPDTCDSEVLPSDWQTYAEQKGVPEERIFASWRKFKAMSSFPWQSRRWKGWVDRERV